MTIELITDRQADVAGRAEERVLLEQRPGFYPEFQAALDELLQARGGRLCFRAPSGGIYVLRPVAGDGPAGVEIGLRKTDAPPAEPEVVDRDLWAFFEWLMDRVGGEWSSDALRRTGAIYRMPGAPERR